MDYTNILLSVDFTTRQLSYEEASVVVPRVRRSWPPAMIPCGTIAGDHENSRT
jgi:hypothetical protein